MSSYELIYICVMYCIVCGLTLLLLSKILP